jgi:hypothetical protein
MALRSRSSCRPASVTGPSSLWPRPVTSGRSGVFEAQAVLWCDRLSERYRRTSAHELLGYAADIIAHSMNSLVLFPTLRKAASELAAKHVCWLRCGWVTAFWPGEPAGTPPRLSEDRVTVTVTERRCHARRPLRSCAHRPACGRPHDYIWAGGHRNQRSAAHPAGGPRHIPKAALHREQSIVRSIRAVRGPAACGGRTPSSWP